MSVASRSSTRASKLPVTQLVFVAWGAFHRSTPCVCALRAFLPGRVFPDRTTRRHGSARPPPSWVGWAERVVTPTVAGVAFDGVDTGVSLASDGSLHDAADATFLAMGALVGAVLSEGCTVMVSLASGVDSEGESEPAGVWASLLGEELATTMTALS